MRRKLSLAFIAAAMGMMLIACGSEKSDEAEPTKAVVKVETGGSETETGSDESTPAADENETPVEGEGEKTETPDQDEDQPTIIGIDKDPTAEVTTAPDQIDEIADNDPVSAEGTVDESDLYIVVNGRKIVTGEDFLPDYQELGVDPEVVQGQACLEGGFDTNYYYGEDLVVYTIAKDGKQIIYDIFISGPAYATRKGVKTGETTKEEVRRLYGDPQSELPASDVYAVLDTPVLLSVIYDGDVVESIDIVDASLTTNDI